jgi:hypothetical protein
MKNIYYLLFTIALFSACNRRVAQKTDTHRTIAVLPAEMIFTGKQPKNITPEDIAKMEEAESKTFQQFLHDNILQNGNTAYYTLQVAVQNYINTISLLSENNISIRESWYKTDEELEKILKVDAVIRMKIQKNRYMSDAASMGIDYGRQIIGAVTQRNIYVPNKTNDIIATCSVVSNGETLWNNNYRRAANWNVSPDEVINNITGNFARRLPYRKRI